MGSFNADLVSYMARMPQSGETVMGDRFVTGPGGKGSNQAVAAARLGAQITFIARVGQDTLAEIGLNLWRSEGIDTSYISRDPDAATGVRGGRYRRPALLMEAESAVHPAPQGRYPGATQILQGHRTAGRHQQNRFGWPADLGTVTGVPRHVGGGDTQARDAPVGADRRRDPREIQRRNDPVGS